MTKVYTPTNKDLPVGKEHHAWKGDSVSYGALHDYIKYYKPKPKVCDDCHKPAKRIDLANISQKYKRDFDDWEWLCRSCHMNKDGRINNLMRGNKPKRYAPCGRGVAARGICIKQYEYERRFNRGRTVSRQTPCESCAG